MSDINLNKEEIQYLFEKKIEEYVQQNRACNQYLQGSCFGRYAISNGLIFGYYALKKRADEYAVKYESSVSEIKELIELAYEKIYNK